MRNLRGSRVLFAAVVVVVLGGLYALAGLRHPISLSAGSAPTAPRSVPVTSVTRVCPAPGAQFSRGGGIAVMAAPGGRRGQRNTEQIAAPASAGPAQRRGRDPAGGPGPQLGRPGRAQHHQGRDAAARHRER